MNGFVAEGPGANMFYGKTRKLFTPPARKYTYRYNKSNCSQICDALNILLKKNYLQQMNKGSRCCFLLRHSSRSYWGGKFR